ncbi:MAG: OmpA family protein [Archangium sp.]|nr:OmpA family protein [Archangium sp.]
MHLTSRTFSSLVLLASTAFAQEGGDEWGTVPAPPPPPAATAPATPPPPPAPPPKTPPAQPPAAAPPTFSAPAPSSRARARAEERLRAAGGLPDAGARLAVDGGIDDSAFPIVSQKESYLEGTEPHSPATWGKSVTAPENARVTVGQAGIGGMFLPSAKLGAAGVVRVSVLGEYLNQVDFPVRNAQNIRSAVNFAASFQPFSWGEVFISYGAAANTNNRTSPNLIQALGDLTFGIKASKEWVKGFHAGADLRLLTFSGVGNQSIDRFAVGFRPTLLATYDMRAVAPKVPVIATVNIGATIDSTAGLTSQRLNASEEFALGINHYSRFNFGLGIDVPLPVVTPLIEYSLAAPLGVPSTGLVGPDGAAVQADAAMQQRLGLGLKITAFKDITILSGVNIGLARSVALGIPATAPWNFFLGASFAIDPFQRGETKLVETVRERKVETASTAKVQRVQGTVVDSAKKPIAGAIIAIAGLAPSATDGSGRFTTLEVKELKAKVMFTRDGYKPTERDVSFDTSPIATIDVTMEDDVKKAVLELTATAAKKPVKASFEVKGSIEARAQSDDGAPKQVEVLSGTYTVNVTAEGFLAQTREVQVSPGGTMSVAFELVPTPKQKLVTLKGDKLEISQQVHFVTGKATIMADSFSLLQQVVDAVVKNGVKRLRVEGHTDNRGDKNANQALSEARARAVADALINQGVDRARIESTGYGDTRPIAPNLTARGRELNRRVEFLILER